jgi:hypothetical protein
MVLARRAEENTGRLADSDDYSLTNLAKMFHMSRRSVVTQLDTAVDAGFLWRDAPTKEAARTQHARTKYRLLMPRIVSIGNDDQASEVVMETDFGPVPPRIGGIVAEVELVQDLHQTLAGSALELGQDLHQAGAKSAHKAFPSSPQIPSPPSRVHEAVRIVMEATGAEEEESNLVVEKIKAAGLATRSLPGLLRAMAEHDRNGDHEGGLVPWLDQARAELAERERAVFAAMLDDARKDPSQDCEHGTPAGRVIHYKTKVSATCARCRGGARGIAVVSA